MDEGIIGVHKNGFFTHIFLFNFRQYRCLYLPTIRSDRFNYLWNHDGNLNFNYIYCFISK